MRLFCSPSPCNKQQSLQDHVPQRHFSTLGLAGAEVGMIILTGMQHQDLVSDAFRAAHSLLLRLLYIITGFRLTHTFLALLSL